MTAMIEQIGQWLAAWAGTHLVRIALIAIAALLLARLLDALVRRFSRAVESRAARLGAEGRQRIHTLAGVFRSLGIALILIVAVLMALSELTIDITPLIAGAGIVGLAIGLGAQTLVKDLIGGLFILLEDQYHIGDVVKVGAVSGTVEQITLRATYLRDGDGTLHLVPNGEIRVVSNATAGWARAIVDARVGYDQDSGKALRVLQAVVDETNADPEIKSLLLEPLALTGVEALDADAMRLRIAGKTAAGAQDAVSRAVRRRIKERFDAEGIAPVGRTVA